ncbi:MAG: hypothetical protein NC124_03000 [Clostridium sp.]|nr:hypothetical protein [Clostridium sp.]
MKKLLIIASLCFMFGAAVMPAQVVSAEESTEETKVRTGHITDPEFRNVAWDMMGSILDNQMELQYVVRDIDWTVKKKSIKTTAYFYKSKGTTVSIDITTSASAWGGIIDAGGNVKYVTGKNLEYSFTIPMNDTYCVFVQNNNSSKITAKGTYRK